VSSVDTVMIAGTVMKREGRMLAEGLAGKKAALRRSAERIVADFTAAGKRAA
jgi:hypothetical protein